MGSTISYSLVGTIVSVSDTRNYKVFTRFLFGAIISNDVGKQVDDLMPRVRYMIYHAMMIFAMSFARLESECDGENVS